MVDPEDNYPPRLIVDFVDHPVRTGSGAILTTPRRSRHTRVISLADLACAIASGGAAISDFRVTGAMRAVPSVVGSSPAGILVPGCYQS